MQPNLDPNLFRRSYVIDGYPCLAFSDGSPCRNSQFVNRLNQPLVPTRPLHGLFFCIFHSHDVRTPSDLPALQKLRAQLLTDIQLYQYHLQFHHYPIVQFALNNELTLDKIFLMKVEEKITQYLNQPNATHNPDSYL